MELKKVLITVYPFFSAEAAGKNYWQDVKDELLAWEAVRKICESKIPKVLQNGLYDIQYIWRMGIKLNAYKHDTQYLHHSMQPELLKV